MTRPRLMARALAVGLAVGACAPASGMPPSEVPTTIAPLPAAAPSTFAEVIALPAQVADSWRIVVDDIRAGELATAGTDAPFLADDLRAYALRLVAAIDPASDPFLGEPTPADAQLVSQASTLAESAAAAADRAARRCDVTVPEAADPGAACERALDRLERAMRALESVSGAVDDP